MSAYPKLVRDKIPELIKERGATPRVRLIDQANLYPWLLIKLREEIKEFEESPCVEELADMYEVLRALALSLSISVEELEQERQKKYEERGGFHRGIVLEEIEEA